MPIVEQHVAQIGQFGLAPTALPMQHCRRIGRRRVRVVAPTLSVKVDRGIAGIIVGRVARLRVPAAEALQARPGLQLGAVDCEVLVREQPGRAGLRRHRVEEGGGDVAGQQPISILGKRRGMPHRVVHV